MFEDRSFVRFTKVLVVSVLAGAALVMLFVMIVDPYRLHRVVEKPGFNLVKPGLERFQKEIKVVGAQAVRANVFLMGNSRVEIGLDPHSKVLVDRNYSAYNLGVPGSGLSLIRQEFEQLRTAGVTPSLVFVGAEFLDFLVDPQGVDTPVTPGGRSLERLQWRVDTVFSVGALTDAVKTLQIQHNAEAVTLTSRGFNPLLEYGRYVRDEGYNAIFRQRAAGSAASLMRRPHGLVRERSGTSNTWKTMHALLSEAAASKAEVHLVIYPYHAQLLAMFEEAGLWPVFEEWKARLVDETARVQRENPGAKLTVWDFSGYGEIQCERIPPPGDFASTTKWYWEAGHFKPALGDLILARVLDGPSASALPHDFGTLLGMNNLDQNRERIARQRDTCVAEHPGLFKEVAEMMGAPRQRVARVP